MSANNLKPLLFILAAALAVGCACTENPFSDDDKITPVNRMLSGQVRLNDGSSPAGTFIWLEALNLTTRCEPNGTFKLVLPSASAQPGGGLTGEYALYFYMANYRLVSRKIFLRAGMIQPGIGGIDSKGKIIAEILLTKLVTIATRIVPAFITRAADTLVVVHLDLQGLESSVSCGLPTIVLKQQVLLNGFLLQSQTSPESVYPVVPYPDHARPLNFLPAPLDPLSYRCDCILPAGMLAAGRYTVIPYIIIRQSGLPEPLLTALGPSPESFDARYLAMPFIRSCATLVVE